MRDRIAVLKQIMTESGTGLPYNCGRMNSVGFMTGFFAKVYKLRTILGQIQTYYEEIVKLHNEILSTPDQNQEHKDQLEKLMEYVKRDTSIVRAQLKEIEVEISKEKSFDDRCQSTEIRIKRTQHSALSYLLNALMTDYNLCQVEFRRRCKDRIHRQLSIANQEMNDEQLEDLLETGNVAIFTQDIMTETEQAKRSLADVEARHLDIIKLEKSIKDLHEMFVDMAILIETQGAMVDRIEYNVSKAQDYVEQAVLDTKKAVTYHQRANKKKVIVAAILSLIALVILAIIFGSVYGKK